MQPATGAMRISLAAAVLALGLAGCLPPAPAAGSLPFTTIERKDDAAYIGQQQYNALDPGLLVFLDAASAAENEDLFSQAARELLARVDWRTQFVVAVFRGWQGGSGYGVTVERVALEGMLLRIHVNFETPDDSPSGAVTSPYHLIAVRRPLAPVEGLSFEIVLADAILLTTTPALP